MKHMTVEKIREILRMQRRCVFRNVTNTCNGHCNLCDLHREDSDLLLALDKVIEILDDIEDDVK